MALKLILFSTESVKQRNQDNIQFCFNGFEVGYAEVGNCQNGHNTDRYIDGGMLKLPKQLKNMMAKMVKARPDLIRSLKTVGFIIMGKLFKSKK
ncbi:hypothetical protein CU097_003076, partial [Rhizopus azygosporus]